MDYSCSSRLACQIKVSEAMKDTTIFVECSVCTMKSRFQKRKRHEKGVISKYDRFCFK